MNVLVVYIECNRVLMAMHQHCTTFIWKISMYVLYLLLALVTDVYHKRIWHISIRVKFDMDLCQRCQRCCFCVSSIVVCLQLTALSWFSWHFEEQFEENQVKATSSPSHWWRRHRVTLSMLMSMTRPLNGSSLYSHYVLCHATDQTDYRSS